MAADPARLEQIFCNLLNNAAKYTDPEGRIRLTVIQEKGFAVISVRDNGIGIAAELLARVFDLFTQAYRSRSFARRAGHRTHVGQELGRTS